MACKEPSMRRVDDLNKRVEKAELKLADVDRMFEKLVSDYSRIDDKLRDENDPKIEMQLFRAYLQQYEDVRNEMFDDLKYSYSQLKDLKEDFLEGRYTDSLRNEYLNAEEIAIRKVESRLEYFIDRFEGQSEFVKEVDNQ